MSTKEVVLVTGGSGLVGQAIRTVAERDDYSKYTFFFASSSDADLAKLDEARALFAKVSLFIITHYNY